MQKGRKWVGEWEKLNWDTRVEEALRSRRHSKHRQLGAHNKAEKAFWLQLVMNGSNLGRRHAHWTPSSTGLVSKSDIFLISLTGRKFWTSSWCAVTKPLLMNDCRQPGEPLLHFTFFCWLVFIKHASAFKAVLPLLYHRCLTLVVKCYRRRKLLKGNSAFNNLKYWCTQRNRAWFLVKDESVLFR